VIEKVLVTLRAGLKVSFPACEAVTEQTPRPTMWTVARRIVHVPLAANETGSRDEAVALTLKSPSAVVLVRRVAKRMVWEASLGHATARLPSAEQMASDEVLPADHPAAERLMARSRAAPASRTPQPRSGVQSDPALRRADCLMMSATWTFVSSGRAAQMSAATPATSGAANDVPET
jgi:hypothetical protein